MHHAMHHCDTPCSLPSDAPCNAPRTALHCTPRTAPCTGHQVLSTLLLFGHALYADLAQLITALPPALGWMVARPSETPQRAQKVYVRWLNIQPMRVLLSCRSVAGGNGFEVVYGDHVHGEAAMGVLNSASAMVANIDRASVRLKALVGLPAEPANSILVQRRLGLGPCVLVRAAGLAKGYAPSGAPTAMGGN